MLHAGDRSLVQPSLRDFAQIQHHILDMEQVATKLALRPAPLSSTAEEVFVHLFLLRPGQNHFASPEMRRFETVRRARVGLRRVSAAVVLAGVAWGAYNLRHVLEASEEDQRVAQQISSLNQEYDKITRALPSFGVGGSTMRDSVAFYNFSIRDFPRLTEFAGAFSQVLDRHPEVRLAQIAWTATDDPKAMPALGRSALRVESPPVKSVSAGAAPPVARPAEAADGPFSGGRYEVALVEGTVRVANNDFRGALEAVERLATDVGAIPGASADVVESPLDTRSSYEILGKHSGNEPATMEPRFVLRVVRDHRGAS
jgi:hypothetical protein